MRTRSLTGPRRSHRASRAGGLALGVAVALACVAVGCGDAGTEGKETADACNESDLIAQCPPGSSPLFASLGESTCDGQVGIDLINPRGEVTGRCVGFGSCTVACQFDAPCACGVAAVTREGVFCVPCADAAVCGNGVCEGGENPETCPQDCSPECVESEERCSDLFTRAVCNRRGEWEEIACQLSEVCDRLGDLTVCRRGDVLAGFEDVSYEDPDEPILPGRILPDRGVYPGQRSHDPHGAILGLELVQAHSFCRSTPGLTEPTEECPWIIPMAIPPGTTRQENTRYFGGPGATFFAHQRLLSIRPSVPSTTVALRWGPLDAMGLPSDEMGFAVEDSELWSALNAISQNTTIGQTADRRWLALVRRTTTPTVADHTAASIAPIDDELIVVDLEDGTFETVWSSGTWFAALRVPHLGALPIGAELIPIERRFQEHAEYTDGAGILRSRVVDGAPRVFSIVSPDDGTHESVPRIQGDIEAMDLSHDGRLLALVRHHVEIWDIERDERVVTILRRDNVRFVDVSFTGADDRLLVINDAVEVWNLQTQQLDTRISLDNFRLDATSLSPDGRSLARARAMLGEVEIFDLETGATVASAELEFYDPSHSGAEVVFSGDGSRLLVATIAGLQIFEVLR